MKLSVQSSQLEDYVQATPYVNFTSPQIEELSAELFDSWQSETEKIRVAFHYVRDEIAHSWDIQNPQITCTATDVFKEKHGICYAKANLLAALLRSQQIPTGFCYQRLMLFDTPEKGYCIHALNAVYVASIQKWIRLDARGNKEGVDAQFSLTEEKLAFPVNEQKGEVDYPIIYTEPHKYTMITLEQATNAMEMYKYHLPQTI